MKNNKLKQFEFSLDGLKKSVDKNKKVNVVEKLFDSVSEKVFEALNAGYSKSQVLRYLQEQGLDISYNTFNKYLKLHQTKSSSVDVDPPFVLSPPVAVEVDDGPNPFEEPVFEKPNNQWGGL